MADTPWTPEQAASNGAVFMDEHRPGWHNEVDPATLDINKGCRCVLGQLHDDYGRGLDAYGLTCWPADRVEILGFEAPVGLPVESWNVLTDAWRREILARRNKDTAGQRLQDALLQGDPVTAWEELASHRVVADAGPVGLFLVAVDGAVEVERSQDES